MPPNTVYVGRPTRYGNPFRIGGHYKRDEHGGIPRMGLRFIYLEAYEGNQDASYTTLVTGDEVLDWFRWYQTARGSEYIERLRQELRGKDLACWCKEGAPCHADILLEFANA
jgi:hypothetical protein